MANLSARAESLIADVTTWHVPPVCQGQSVEVSFGASGDSTIVCRTVDRSEGSTRYEIADHEDLPEGVQFDPWNWREVPALEWRPLA